MSQRHRQQNQQTKEINVLFEAPPGGMSLIQALETSLLQEFRAESRVRAFTILLNLDRLLARLSHLSPSNIRQLGGRAAQADERVLIDEVATNAKSFFREANHEEQNVFTEILKHREIQVGPKGRDSLNRSTRALRLSIGRIVFD